MQWLTVGLQSPLWLWLLGALAIPLLIHLLRRSSPREITFAAAHWLQRKPPQNWKRLFLRDKWLLLLRLLLIALLALLLAQPLLPQSPRSGENILLVDPRVERADLREFLATEFAADDATPTDILWLEENPLPIDEPPPAAPDLWRALSALADRATFRHAHILLRSDVNPSGHDVLSTSPHWQWHALQKSARESSATPRIGLRGDGPPWLQPALQQLRNRSLPQLTLQPLAETATVDATKLDWLIYDTPGALPESLHNFVRDGGLLISDLRVQAPAEVTFAGLDTAQGKSLEAAAIGRGSWLRYRQDWHGEEFFHRADLPQILWQQWTAQDWALQSDNRGNWSIDAVPSMAIADAEIKPLERAVVARPLLVALLLLLALERILALGGAVRRGGRRD